MEGMGEADERKIEGLQHGERGMERCMCVLISLSVAMCPAVDPYGSQCACVCVCV